MSTAILVSPAAATVTTKGTAVRLVSAAVSNVTAVFVTAPSTNTGAIWVGDSTVLNSSAIGTQIAKGATVAFYSTDHQLDIYNMWVDADNNSDKATVSYIRRLP